MSNVKTKARVIPTRPLSREELFEIADALKVPEPGDPSLVEEETRLANMSASADSGQPAAQAAPRRMLRVTLELTDSTISMPAVEVLRCAYGLTVLLPLEMNGCTFVPKTGSEVTVSWGDSVARCYFPGVHFEWTDKSVMGLCFVLMED